MPLRITPDVIRNAYEYLRSTRPFNSWKLPHADKIQIRTVLAHDKLGEWRFDNKHHCISINDKYISTSFSLLTTLAHEMIHMAQYVLKTETSNSEHNKDFFKKVKTVARHHGFDSKWF